MDQASVSPLRQADLALETGRLLLRPMTMDDMDLARALFTDPEVMRFVAEPIPEDELPAKLRTITRRAAGGRIGIWCVLDRSSGKKLGTAVLLPVPVERETRDWSILDERAYPEAEIEVGYILRRSAWGKGIASEACTRMLRFAFEATPLAEIVAVTHPDNLPSQRVLLKCGLRGEGPRRAYATTVAGFRITRADWRRLASGS